MSPKENTQKRNQRSQQGNPNHKPFEYASDWEDHDYVSHLDFPEYAACGATGAVIKFGKNGGKIAPAETNISISLYEGNQKLHIDLFLNVLSKKDLVKTF